MEKDNEQLQGIDDGRVPERPEKAEIEDKTPEEEEAALGLGVHEVINSCWETTY